MAQKLNKQIKHTNIKKALAVTGTLREYSALWFPMAFFY